MTTLTSATTYHPEIMEARQTQGWDDYDYRLSRYEIQDGFYHNMQYHRIKSYSQALKTHEQLYKHVRGVYNPVKRLVDSYVSKIYGGVLDIKDAQKGSIPIDADNDLIYDAITKLWIASQWGQKKSLYTRYGAKFGDSFLKVVDDIHKGQVRLEPVDPMKVKSVEKDPDGSITKIVFEYYIRKDGQLVKYREEITPDYFDAQTEDGDALYTNGRNEAVTRWDNEYGFVPIKHIQHTDEGLMYGASCTHGLFQKINELNDIASILNDGMRRQVNLPLVALNAKVGTMDAGSDQSSDSNNTSDNPKKDTMNVLQLIGEKADLKTLSPTVNIADGLANILEILREIERDSPELSLHRLRDSSNLTAPGVRSGYDDAISKFQESRGNYDTGLVDAQKMAISIGGMRGYQGYQGFSLMSLEAGSLEHQIKDRPVINDTLGLNEKLALTASGVQSNMPKSYFLSMGWGDDEAQEYVDAGQSAQNSFMMTSPFETVSSTPLLDDPNATPQDAFDIEQNAGVNGSDIINADRLLAEVV